MTISARPQQNAISFRGRSLLAFVLTPKMPIEGWLEDLDSWLARSPGFFAAKPVMLEVSSLGISRDDYRQLVRDLAGRDVHVMAVEGAGPDYLDVDLPPMVNGGRSASVTALLDQAGKEPKPEPARPASMVIEGNVRSGQSIFFPDGDVTIIGSVASGAEVIAGASVHIYGTLRGRAMAGVSGVAGARIFCKRLEAEMMSIGGTYKTAEHMGAHVQGRSVQARLAGAEMQIVVLD